MTDRAARETGTPNPNDATPGKDHGPAGTRTAWSGEEGVTDQAAGVEAEGGRTGGLWTRRALAGSLLLGAGGLTLGRWPRRNPALPDSGDVVPLRSPVKPAEPAPWADMPREAGATEAPSKEASAAQPADTATVDAREVPATATRPEGRPQIAVVIDDLGLRQEETRWATSLPGPLTLAFLPYGQSLGAHTGRAMANGHEVIVHLPMDPGGRADPGPKALLVGQNAAEMAQRLAWGLAQLPQAVGVNNHMGSALTENAAAMEAVLAALKQQGRYFLDSRTTAKSVARATAHRLELPFAERDVFLDNDTSPQAIARQLAETEELARRYGSAIAIGHPHRQTLRVLESWVGAAQARGFDIVPVSTIIATRGSALWRLARDRRGGAES